MRRTLLEITVFEDGDQTKLHYQNRHPGEPVSADAFDQLIAVLGEFRASASPHIPTDPPAPHRPVFATFDPRWQIAGDPMGGGAIFRIRHPGFGWLAFSVPLHELVRFADGASRIAQSMADEVTGCHRAN